MVDIRAMAPSGERVRDRRVVGGTKPQARAWGIERERELTEGRGKPAKTASVTFAAFVADWWPTYEKKGHRASGLRYTGKTIRVHLAPFFGEMLLERVCETETLDRFVSHMFRKASGRGLDAEGKPATLRPTSVKHAVDVLHTVLAAAESWKKIAKVPRMPTVKRDSTHLKLAFYSTSESVLILRAARDDDDRMLLMFALHTGCRAGEQIGLEWGDLDLVAKRVDVRRSRVEGVTNESTKNRGGRSIPLTDPLAAALNVSSRRKGKYVFGGADGKALTLGDLRKVLRRATTKAGLPLLRWHDLRHSFASNLVIAGCPIRQVQEWLGHSSITMTMRYSHLAPGGGREHLVGLCAHEGYGPEDTRAPPCVV